MAQPLVSVVVATRNRPARLRRLLEALSEQTLPAERFELIVVSDAAGPETLALLRGAEHDLPSPRVLSHPSARGPGAARNTGWRAAEAPLVAFTDDDCRPSPGWLAALLARSKPGLFVQGVTLPDPQEQSQHGPLSRTVRSEQLGPQFETCNIAYPTCALRRLGGFDEGFGLTPGGEDTDLAWRAIEAGWKPALAPDALVWHAVERIGVAGTLRVAARWSETVRIFARHPSSRSMLQAGIFWNVWHLLMWRSLLALAAPRWLRRMILTRHLLALRNRARDVGGGVQVVPVLLLGDLVECWSIARGALAHRVLVL